jgi:NitT/TauT family transport system ATP-binding protein
MGRTGAKRSNEVRQVNVLEVKKLTKVFDAKTGAFLAVQDVSFNLEENDFVSLVGPSGCGKSTIIRMINGITPITDGSIMLFGQGYGKQVKGEVVKKMGFIFQSPNLLPWLTVRKNLELPLKVFKLRGPKYKKNVDELLKVFGLDECQGEYPASLSGGMTQRVGVMRAMVHDPEILLMDEPYGALDEDMREQLDMETLAIWKRTGTSVIFITHNITEAVLMSKRVVVMGTDPGRLLEEIKIDLPYPRSLEMIETEKFKGYEREIIKLIGILDLAKIV